MSSATLSAGAAPGTAAVSMWKALDPARLSWLQPRKPGGCLVAEMIDPYLLWADLTDFAGYGNIESFVQKVPLAIEVKAAGAIATLVGSGLIEVPARYTASTGRYFTAYVQPKNLSALASHAAVARIELGLPLEFLKATRGDVLDPNPPAAPTFAAAQGPIIGVIDLECAFLNDVFCTTAGQGTRIRALWDQSNPPPKRPNWVSPDWVSPEGFGYGREIVRARIDALRAGAAGDPQRERDVYRNLEYLHDAQGRLRTESHGTHVLDTAAGRVGPNPSPASSKPAQDDAASDAELIVVNVPRPPDSDTTGASLCVQIIDAIHYIVDRAQGAPQIVVNLSIGSQAGPHDGSSLIEEAIDEVVVAMRKETPPRTLAIVMAAGNGFEAKCHVEGVVAARGVAEFLWRILPEDNTDSFLEIWFDGSASGVTIEVISPTGNSSGPIGVGAAVTLDAGNGDPCCMAAFCKKSATGTGAMALVAMAPSAVSLRRSAIAAHGLWKVKINNNRTSAANGFHAWVERDDPPVGAPNRKRQSFLVDVNNSTTPVSGFGTLNNIATGVEPVVVAASDKATGVVSRYTAAASVTGNAGSPRRRDPDVLAPADESQSFGGLIAAGVLSGQTYRMGGTSVSAPVVARALACAMQGHTGQIQGRANLVSMLSGAPKRSRGPAPAGPPQRPNYPSRAKEIKL